MPSPALIAALLITGPAAALAQVGGDLPGDPAAGRALAEEVCSACHVIPGSFQALAADRAVTGMALHAFLRGWHPTLPNIMLSDEELNNVIAYILSLKEG